MCPQHHRGLLDFTVNDEHHTQLSTVLDQLREPETTTLRVLTFEPHLPDNLVELPVACNGSMVCECAECAAVIAGRIKQGVRPSHSLPIKRKAA